MTISIDWANRLILSTASISDVVAFKDTLRDFEDDATGVLYPPTITYKRIDLGEGAFMHAVDAINGYQIKFPDPGNYTIVGNINANIVPVAGVYVERIKAAAFSTTAVGGTGPSAESIAAATASLLQTMFLPVDMQKTNGVEIIGDGTEGNKFRSIHVG